MTRAFLVRFLPLVPVLLLLVVLSCSDEGTNPRPAVIVAQSSFGTDADGWTCEGDGEWSWQESGGNTGGYLQSIDPASGANTVAIAPQKFLGSWTSLDAKGTLSYDFQVFEGAGAPYEAPNVTISGPGGSATAFTAAGPVDLGTWAHCSVPIKADAWTVESGTWLNLIASITKIEIDMESVNGPESTGIDNVKLVK